jgi:ribosomal protein S18 acetylase RimI-like enzyme
MKMTTISDQSFLVGELERNLWETWSIFGCGPNCILHEEEDLLWFETPIPIIPYNGVLRFQMQSIVDQTITRIVEHFKLKQSQFMWILHPSSNPTDLRERLLTHGLKDVEPVLGMVRHLDHLPELIPFPENIEVRKVVGQKDASAFYQFATWRWNVPEEYQLDYETIAKGFRLGHPDAKVHMWQAWRNGKPIAKAGMYLSSNSAGIYAVVTRPEARRLGLARALTLIALHHAHSRGYQLAVLHSTPMAESLYRSLGFSTIAEFRIFASHDVYI